MSELKPCPFCGGEAKMRRFASGRIFNRITVYFAECCVCRCKTSVELDTKTAEEAWNRRAEECDLLC